MDKAAWDQIKSVTASELMAAARRDGWALDVKGGSSNLYRKGNLTVDIHFHPHKTYGPKMLKQLLVAFGWSAKDLRRLKLIK